MTRTHRSRKVSRRNRVSHRHRVSRRHRVSHRHRVSRRNRVKGGGCDNYEKCKEEYNIAAFECNRASNNPDNESCKKRITLSERLDALEEAKQFI